MKTCRGFLRLTKISSRRIRSKPYYQLLAGEAKISDNLKGAIWISLSCVFAAVMVTLIKSIGQEVSSVIIVTGRCVFGLLILAPILWKNGLAPLNSSQLKLHLLRGCFVAVGINLGFYSLTILPITTVTILFFTAPLFVTLLARPMIGEMVGWRRLSATLVGFVGAVIVISPTVDDFNLELLIPVASSVFFSVSLVLHKQLSKTDPPWVLMFYMFTMTLVLTMPFAAVEWRAPGLLNVLIIMVIAVFATFRTYSDIRGYSTGEVSFVALFQYLRILFVGITAYYLFGEVLANHEWAGMLVIISSTLYIAQREYRLNRKLTVARTEDSKLI